ncbi:MAG: type IV pilus modification protein PilV [Janthinobacterium lividum]
MNRPSPPRTAIFSKGQAGSFLLEGLVAILIFSIGILGLIGLQLSAIKQSSDASYRSEAAMYANELIGTMWVSDHAPAALKASFEAGGAGYLVWKNRVAASLPGVSDSSNLPQVSVDAASSTVTVKVFWQAPGAEPHNHVIVAQIR